MTIFLWRDRVDSELLGWDDDFQQLPKTVHRDLKKKGRSSGGTHLFIKKTQDSVKVLNLE